MSKKNKQMLHVKTLYMPMIRNKQYFVETYSLQNTIPSSPSVKWQFYTG